jgi:hypothetical protein
MYSNKKEDKFQNKVRMGKNQINVHTVGLSNTIIILFRGRGGTYCLSEDMEGRYLVFV